MSERVAEGERWPEPRAQVVLLYPAEEARSAAQLKAVWCDELPRADFIDLETTPNQAPMTLADQIRPLITDPQRAVCVGLFGAEPVSLRLAVTLDGPLFRGLVCQNGLPEHQVAVIPHPSSRGMKVRLVWEVEDAPASKAVMAEVLAAFRRSGIEAQGTVLSVADRPSPGSIAAVMRSTGAIRLLGSYLAELVAIALDPAIPTRTNPSV